MFVHVMMKMKSALFLKWVDGFLISESDPCSPNPCNNGGLCIAEEGEFSCACNGTGYVGPTCGKPVVYLEYIPPITEGTDIPVTISTMTEREKDSIITVTAKGSGGFAEEVKINFHRTDIRDEIKLPGKVGIVTVSLSNEDFKYEPKQRIVFVSEGNPNTSYFQELDLPSGQLKPSCCTPDIDNLEIKCPASTQSVSLKSTCKWSTTGSGVTRSPGVVFAEGTNVSLPTSISGLRYRNKGTYINNLIISKSECTTCNACENDLDGQCYCYNNFTLVDTQDLLHARALSFTYIGEIHKLLPSWLQMSVNLNFASKISPLTDYDSFAPITRQTDSVSSIAGCSTLTNLSGSIYSVLRHDKTLSITIDGTQYDYRENGDNVNPVDPMCFAVDLCDGLSSPVHMQISQQVNDILVSQYLRDLTSRQWNIRLNTASVFRSEVEREINVTFWNGMDLIAPTTIKMDVSINLDARVEFRDDPLHLALEFSGSAHMNYKVSILPICITILFMLLFMRHLCDVYIGQSGIMVWPNYYVVDEQY